MGIDIDGGMIVGERGDKLSAPEYAESLSEWLYEDGIERMSLYYDADDKDCYFGIPVPNIPIGEIDGWLETVKLAADKFKAITGVPAMLIGTQSVW